MPLKDPIARREYSRTYQRKWIKLPHVRAKRKVTHDRWIANNPKRIAELEQRYLPSKANRIREKRRCNREKALQVLGSKCVSADCRWMNEDGTLGCRDPRLLQIDHKLGGGTQERNRLSYDTMLRRIAAGNTKGYQLLCASCNWLKAHTNKEFACMEKYENPGN